MKEKNILLEVKKNERTIYQKQIATLAQKREAYIKVEKAKTTLGTDDFGTSVSKSIQTKAKIIGFNTVSPK